MPWSLKNFLIKRVAVVDSGDNPEAEVLLFKQQETNDKGGANMSKTFEELMKELPEEDRVTIEGEIKKTQDELEKAKADMVAMTDEEKKKKMEEEKAKMMMNKEATDEDLIKSADPKIQELVKKLQEDGVKDKEELKKVQDEKDAKDAELKKELLSKEAEKYPNIGATKEDIVKILEKVDEDTSTLIKAVLSADNEALKDNAIIKSVGSSGDGADKTAKQEIEEKAQALAKAEKITIEKARTKIYKSEPELMKKFREEE